MSEQKIMAAEGWDWLLIAGWIVAGLLVLAVFDMGSAYYAFLRWCVFATSIFFIVYGVKFNRNPKIILGIAAGLLWNPLVPIYLDRGIWFWLDLLFAVAFFFVSDGKVPERLESKDDRPENWT
jgi:hypothetical protein